MVNHPGRPVTIYQIARLFKGAFACAAVMQTALKGFEKTGIFPFNRSIFPDHLFDPADTTDRPAPQASQAITDEAVGLVPETEEPQGKAPQGEVPEAETFQEDVPQANVLQDKVSRSSTTKELPDPQDELVAVPGTSGMKSGGLVAVAGTSGTPSGGLVAVPGTSEITSGGLVAVAGTSGMPSSFSVSPKLLMPPPKVNLVESVKKITNRKKGKTVILTSSPYKNDLEAEEKARKEKQEKKN